MTARIDIPSSDMTAPTLDEIEEIARRTVAALPAAFRGRAQEVALRVADFASEEMLEEIGGEAFDLTGLYEGIPMTEKSAWDMPERPDTVWLFRRPILDEWAERGDATIGDLVAHVTVHEFAHHFGWSDDDIAAIDQWWR
ncbi:metallopeptidase family protein [Pseudoroseicyclus aestuarii]|uniref:Putative Zn-dependent protease with MMP-like domain n=1 Tax=Pseudoroseicyclus aestuarii TaxID=1795041 RepID=A0A318SU66_9RHOB|nr:metallopeptidase family protein [Pseudoroseicyclus aestuarii]PYE85430.1 putative Zn-dependent protease with MMP-like domain [Pseudoroseicyclus aestuarii]